MVATMVGLLFGRGMVNWGLDTDFLETGVDLHVINGVGLNTRVLNCFRLN